MAKETGTKASVTKNARGKQEELPGVEPSSRRIAEIEDLGDVLVDLEDELSALKEKVKDANENLVVAMKKRDKTYYSRQTWGTVILKETHVSAKVKKSSAAAGEDAED